MKKKKTTKKPVKKPSRVRVSSSRKKPVQKPLRKGGNGFGQTEGEYDEL